MISTNEVLKNLNSKQPKYTNDDARIIKLFLYQLGELTYLQFKQLNNEKEKSNTIRTCVN